MRGFTTLLSTAIAAQAALAKPIHVRTDYAIKETHAIPRKWSQAGEAPGNHMLHMQIGLKQSNFEELERHLYEVSTPDHPRYGQHLSKEAVEGLVTPTDETINLVHEWLFANGVELFDYSPAKDWINIYIDVESAERLLDTRYNVYQHEDGTMIVRTPEWSLPRHLHERIDTIQPTTSFMRATPKKTDWKQFAHPWMPPNYKPPTNETISAVCQFFPVTIECFQTLYGTVGYSPSHDGVNKIAFNNYLGEVPSRDSIFLFLDKYRPHAAHRAYSFKSIEIDGGPAAVKELNETQLENATGEEANLDAETVIGMTFPEIVYSYSTGGMPPFVPDASTPTNTNEPYLTWVNYVLGQTDVPQVISSSYGDSEETVPKSYADRVCQSFAQLGARGISLFVSSGDAGLGGETAEDCIDNKNATVFIPEFPTSCPYVTSVGALQEFEPEVVAWRPNGIGPDGRNHGFYTSGSGFSNYYKRPAYQDGVVDKYVAKLNGLYDGLYNKEGRGYPDISAQGLYFAFVWNNTFSSISGTSASCPLAASVISLVNDALIKAGKPTLGFLNPWLYSKGYQGFTDILGGNTSSCGTNGFPVTEGWDPLTGFGSPIFPVLRSLVDA